MRARILILALVCALAPLAGRAQTAVTGNLKDVGVANASGSNTYVRFTLIDYGAQIPKITNPAGNVIFSPIKDFKPDVNGNISGTIQGNDTISPPATKYQVCIYYQGQQFRCNTYIINGSTFNLNTATPLNSSVQAGANQLVVLSFPFTQATPSSTWTIPHNFNDPNAYVQVFDTTHKIIYPDSVNTSDPNNAVLTFVTPTAGFAIAMHAGAINIATNQPNAIVANPLGAQSIALPISFLGPVAFTQPATVNGLWNFTGGLTAIAPTLTGQTTFGTLFSTDTSGSLLQNFAPTTNQKFIRMGNTGGTFYQGIESSVGGGFFAGSNPYESVLYSPANNLFINSPIVRLQGDLSLGAASLKAINSVQYCDFFSGATADVKINACIAALPANGGTADARGFSSTSQTIAATVTVGTTTKTVTLLLDRTTTFNCTITNNTPCFNKGPGSAIVGAGSAITNPNAGITFSSSAAVSAAIFDQQQSGGNFVGSYLDGISIFGNATMTVSDALVALQCPLQVTHYKDLNIAGQGVQNAIMLKIYGTTACGGGNVSVENVQIDASGATGSRPVWVGCASAGSTTLLACAGISNISFSGRGSTYGHPGSGGIPIFDIECGNGAGGTNTCGSLDFFGLQLESRNAGDIGILANGPESIHVYGLTGTCAVTCGADLVRVAQPAGTQLDGVDIRGLDNQGGWTNTLNNTVNSQAFASGTFPRLNYAFSAGTRQENAGSNVPILGSLVTTAAASDNVTLTGMTANGHCTFSATNASAATNFATTFVSAKTVNQITVSHTATANMNYDVSCTPN